MQPSSAISTRLFLRELPRQCCFLPDEQGEFTIQPSDDWLDMLYEDYQKIRKWNNVLESALNDSGHDWELFAECVDETVSYRLLTDRTVQRIGDCQSMCEADPVCASFSYKISHSIVTPTDKQWYASLGGDMQEDYNKLGAITNTCQLFGRNACQAKVTQNIETREIGTLNWNEVCEWSRCVYGWSSIFCGVTYNTKYSSASFDGLNWTLFNTISDVMFYIFIGVMTFAVILATCTQCLSYSAEKVFYRNKEPSEEEPSYEYESSEEEMPNYMPSSLPSSRSSMKLYIE